MKLLLLSENMGPINFRVLLLFFNEANSAAVVRVLQRAVKKTTLLLQQRLINITISMAFITYNLSGLNITAQLKNGQIGPNWFCRRGFYDDATPATRSLPGSQDLADYYALFKT